MFRADCAHCGLPVGGGVSRGGDVFCCTGCFLASRIVRGAAAEGVLTASAWGVLRLAVGALLSMAVMMTALLLYSGSVEGHLVDTFRWIMLAQALPASALLAYPFLLGAGGEIRRGRLSLDALIAAGALSALGVSVIATVRGDGHVYFDTATMLLTVVTFGKLIEAGAKTRAGQWLDSLERLLPPRATCLREGLPVDVPRGELRPGDLLLVKPGERFPADGEVLQGRSVVEEAAFTGEWAGREIGSGSDVTAGTVNGLAAVTVRVRAVNDDLLLRRIVERVRLAQRSPGRLERQAQRAASWMTPGVLLIAVAAGAGGLAAGESSRAALAALAVLVVACPCAMGIAAPLATAVAIARAADAGALVRGGDVLESLGLVRHVFFDKTGTLTEGLPTLSAPADEAVLQLAAAVEAGCEHPLARAVVAEAKRRRLPPLPARDVVLLPGLGVRGVVTVDGQSRNVVLGSASLLAETSLSTPSRGAGILPARPEGVPPSATPANEQGVPLRQIQRGRDAHVTEMFVACDGVVLGWLGFRDPPRRDAQAVVAELERMGITVSLLSGDSTAATASLAKQLNIHADNAHAAKRPDEKADLIAQAAATVTAARGRAAVAMVGDGINDAPALAQADVGIALAHGSDLAQHAGGVVLLNAQLATLPRLIRLARQARRVIRQNLAWAIAYNAVALAAAAAGALHPLLAAAMMAASCVSVVGNSLRIRGVGIS